MAQGIRPDEQFLAPVVYADIIDLPRWEPGPKHPRMSLYKRAAQFMPFAAVRGYDEMIREDLRETEPEAELSEGQQELLARQLGAIRARLAAGEQPAASVTWFVPDARKEGGKYVTVTAAVRRLDPVARKMFLVRDGREDVPEFVPMDRIRSLQSDIPDWPED